MKRNWLSRCIELAILPFLNVLTALVISGAIIAILGENPFEAFRLLLYGAFGYPDAIGYTLFYTTNFIFTGLAVAVAFHAGQFNIGGEGQIILGGIGIAVVMALLPTAPGLLLALLAIIASIVFGAIWGLIPGWLQARRGSHIVITTIMFNFIAASLLTYLLVNILIAPGQSSPESAAFPEDSWMMSMNTMLEPIGYAIPFAPFNIAFFLAIATALLVWIIIWKTKYGFALRIVGQSERVGRYAGIRPDLIIMSAMALSGALAGMMAINEILGGQHRLTLGFSGGYGFVGIAVALMGYNHPFGIVIAALLFGVLYQGGAELAFDMPLVTRDMVVVIQGLVILFTGALQHMYRPFFQRWLT